MIKESESVALITVATIAMESIIRIDKEYKLDLIERLKAGWKIISAIPSNTHDTAVITYVLMKEPDGKS